MQPARALARILANIRDAPELIASVLIGLAGLATIFLVTLLNASASSVEHTLMVKLDTAGVFSALQDAEAGHRGFLLTERDAYLAPFHVARDVVRPHLARLKDRTRDNRLQQGRLDDLERIIAAMLSEFTRSIDLLRSDRRTAALETLHQNTAKSMMEDARRIIGQIIETEETLLAARRQAASLYGSWLAILAIATVLLAIGLSITSRQRTLAQRQVLEQAIADRTRALDESNWRLALLTRELAHRVKNSLAVIQAIMRSTARTHADPKRFVEAFGGRLQSLAAAQDILTAGQWAGAEIGALFREQLSAHIDSDRPRIFLSGPDVLLPAEYAVPLGLAVHELATNAAKYGALSTPDGTVQVSWRNGPDPDVADHARISLTWVERGGPSVALPSVTGFGSTLIERGVPNATVRRSFEADGLVCAIAFAYPLEAPIQDHLA